MSELEDLFHWEMLSSYYAVGMATGSRGVRGYWACRFLQSVRNNGGVVAARRLLEKTGTSDGFQRLVKEGLLKLSVEYTVLKREYRELFSEKHRQTARDRLGRVEAGPGFDAPYHAAVSGIADS
jgi:5-methylcytosine-specific restriction protein A